VDEYLPVRCVHLIESDKKARYLNNLPQLGRRMQLHNSARQTARYWVIFSVFLGPRFFSFCGPWLVWRTVFQTPADIEELLRNLHVRTAACRAGSVLVWFPDAGKIGLTIGCSWCRSLEIGRAIG